MASSEPGLVLGAAGGQCSTCGFRYWAHKGHVIPCPVCALGETRQKAVDDTCMTIQRAVADYTRRTPPGLRDCDMLTGHIVRAIRNAAPQDDLKGSEALHRPLAGLAASSHRPDATPAVAAPVWVSPTDRNPDLDGRLWAVLIERRENGKRTGFIPIFEYYHFTDGWATDERILFWLDSPLHPLPSVPRE